MKTCDKQYKDQTKGIALIRAIIVIVAIIIATMVGPPTLVHLLNYTRRILVVLGLRTALQLR